MCATAVKPDSTDSQSSLTGLFITRGRGSAGRKGTHANLSCAVFCSNNNQNCKQHFEISNIKASACKIPGKDERDLVQVALFRF